MEPSWFPHCVRRVQCALSSLGAVLNEGVLKMEQFKDLGVNGLGVVLYGQTSCVLFSFICWRAFLREEPISSSFLHLDRAAAVWATMNVALGLTIARVLIHTNAVAKSMASGFREVLTVMMAPLFVIAVGLGHDLFGSVGGLRGLPLLCPW